MQHYGLPTRLMDFTCNSLVALFFACCSNPKEDGAVYEIHAFPLYNQDFVWISIITKYLFEYSQLPFNCACMIDELKMEQDLYPTRGVQSFYSEEEIKKILTSPLGIYPRLTNDRIASQDGVFVIAGMNVGEQTRDGIIFEKQTYQDVKQLWPESRTIIIPSKIKREVMSGLSKLGINKQRLFPELEMQANYVAQYIDLLD